MDLIIFQALESDAMADSTRLPISHPDHSLGAGLGPTSETDDEETDPADATDTDVEGGLPWKPRFNKVRPQFELVQGTSVYESVHRHLRCPRLRGDFRGESMRVAEKPNSAPMNNKLSIVASMTSS